MRRLCITVIFGVTEMKKIISLLIIAATVLSFAACTDSDLKGKVDPYITQGSIDSMQQDVINTFGVSIDGVWIVGYKRESEYLEYIVVKYENGKKASEATHRFYANGSYYKNALLELIDPANGLFDMDASVARIEAWQAKVREYVPNDTGEDIAIHDMPASWSTHREYRLMDKGKDNFFKVKAEAIRKMK